MESTRVDLISLHMSNIPNPALALQNHQYGDLPIPPHASLLSCREAFQAPPDNLSWTAFKVVTVKPRVADIAVKVERTKLVVENLLDGETVDMFVMGLYSANVARLGVVEGDYMFLSGARVVKTRVQPKQMDPSAWSVYVGQELFKKKEPRCKVRFVRLREVQDETHAELDLTEENIAQNIAQTPETCVEFMEVDDNSRIANPIDSGSKVIGTDVSEVVHSVVDTLSDNVASKVVVSPKDAASDKGSSNTAASKVVPTKCTSPRNNIPKVLHIPPAKVYKYTELKQCTKHKSRCNTWGVIKEVVELPTRRKTKLVARLQITDESLDSWGDLSETYKFSILANSMEDIPPLSTGSVLRIHHMAVEFFNGMSDGRVFDARSVVVVEGAVGEDIKPVSTKDDLGELVWSRGDEERVKQLRQFYVESFVYDLKLEEIDKEVVCNLCCVVTKVIEVPDAFVLGVADGTEAKLFALLWKSGESQELPDENVRFVDVLVTHSELVDLVRQRRVIVGSYIRLLGMRCKLHNKVDSQGMTMEYCDTQGNGVVGFEFVLENAERKCVGVEVMHNGDSRVETIKERMGENKTGLDIDGGRDDMDIDALIAAANTNDTFSLPPALSQTIDSSDCVGSYFTRRKRSSQDSLELALGTAASLPLTPKHSVSGLVTSVVPSSPTPSNQQPDHLPNSQQSNESFVSASSSLLMPQLISKQESINVPKSQDTSSKPYFATASWVADDKNSRKIARKQANIQRIAEEVEESSTQAFRDIGETDSQSSSQGSSQFQSLGSPVRQRNVKLTTNTVEPKKIIRKTRSQS